VSKQNKLTVGLLIVSILSVGFAIYTSFSHKAKKPSTNNVAVVAEEPKVVIPSQPVVADLPKIPDYVPAPVQPVAVVSNSPIEPPVVANIIDDSVNNSLVSVPVVEPVVLKTEEPKPVPAPVTQTVAAPVTPKTRRVLQYQTVRMCGQNGCVTQQVPVWVDVPVESTPIPVRTNTYAVPTQPNYNYNQGGGGGFPILGRIFGRR